MERKWKSIPGSISNGFTKDKLWIVVQLIFNCSDVRNTLWQTNLVKPEDVFSSDISTLYVLYVSETIITRSGQRNDLMLNTSCVVIIPSYLLLDRSRIMLTHVIFAGGAPCFETARRQLIKGAQVELISFTCQYIIYHKWLTCFNERHRIH